MVPKKDYYSTKREITLRFVGGKSDRKGRDFTVTVTPLIKSESIIHKYKRTRYHTDSSQRVQG
jgi:hypothetical protein